MRLVSILLLALISAAAHGETLVCECLLSWGGNGEYRGCGSVDGTNGWAWSRPTANTKVSTSPANPSTWPTFGSLPDTALIGAASGKTPGHTTRDECQRDGRMMTKADILAGVTTPAPDPTPNPTPSPPPVITPTGGVFPVTCVAPTHRTDGQPVDALTYVFVVNGVDTAPKTVCSHTETAPGTYVVAAKAIDSSGPSNPSNSLTVAIGSNPPPPPPIDCIVSAWTSWSNPPWSACVNGSQSRNEIRTRTIITQASNGGTSCPSLTDTRQTTQSCASPAPAIYRVKAIASGTRPATELVLALDSVKPALGYKLGDIAVGKPCGDAIVIKSGTTEYHRVLESDATLLSPTYKGRELVAVCGK